MTLNVDPDFHRPKYPTANLAIPPLCFTHKMYGTSAVFIFYTINNQYTFMI